MENFYDLAQEFITKALGDDIKVSPSVAMNFYEFCKENHCIPTRLKELSSKINEAFANELMLSDRFSSSCRIYREKPPQSLKDLGEYLLSYEDLFEYKSFNQAIRYDCRGKYFHKLEIDCSLKFVRFWLKEEGLVSAKTFKELKAKGVKNAVIDELKQINEKNLLYSKRKSWPLLLE